MKTQNDQPKKIGSLPIGGHPGHQPDWWKHNHPNVKVQGSSSFHNSVKPGFWKTYNSKTSGKKK